MIRKMTIIFLLFQLTLPGLVFAAAVYTDDTFDNLLQVDMGKTTAQVDTTNGWVTLGLRNMANSIILYADSYDFTVVNKDAVQTYIFNGSGMEVDFRRSINHGLNEPVGIAGRRGEYIVLDRGERTASRYHFDGAGMVKNDAVSVADDLTDPRAIDVFGDTYDLALLDRQYVTWYSYNGAGMVKNEELSFDMGNYSNPAGLSLENDSLACVVLDKAAKEIRRCYYDGSKMAPDESRSILSGLVDPRSICVSKDGGLFLVVDCNQVKVFNYDGASMVYNSQLSVANLNNPLAAAIKPGDSSVPDYAVLDEDEAGQPCVKYFACGAAGMEEITDLRVGLDEIPYGNDQLLMGKPAAPAGDVAGLKLAADTDTPSGTSIRWEVTVDGANWLPVIPGGEPTRFAVPGTQPNYRAVLHTDDNTITPKICSVQLIDASLTVRGHADKSTYHAGEAMALSAETEGAAERVEAVMWWTGGNGFTGDVITELVPALPRESSTNTWHTRHNYPAAYDRVVIIPQDMPDGDYIVEIKAYRGLNCASDAAPIRVEGSQYDRIKTRLNEQGYLPYE